MISYGIYPAVPIDTVEDPLMGQWQSHITSISISTTGTHTIVIESDNYGYIRLIDSSSNEILDREINYSGGVGAETINLSLDACLLYTSPSPRDRTRSRMPSSA